MPVSAPQPSSPPSSSSKASTPPPPPTPSPSSATLLSPFLGVHVLNLAYGFVRGWGTSPWTRGHGRRDNAGRGSLNSVRTPLFGAFVIGASEPGSAGVGGESVRLYQLLEEEEFDDGGFEDEDAGETTPMYASRGGVSSRGSRSPHNMRISPRLVNHIQYRLDRRKLARAMWSQDLPLQIRRSILLHNQRRPFPRHVRPGQEIQIHTCAPRISPIPGLWDAVKGFIRVNSELVSPDNALAFLSDDGGESYSHCACASVRPSPRRKILTCLSSQSGPTLRFPTSTCGVERHTPNSSTTLMRRGFYYERWADNTVHSIAVALFSRKNQIHFFDNIGVSLGSSGLFPHLNLMSSQATDTNPSNTVPKVLRIARPSASAI
ncbi:hypothetical protein DFH09DRAFT_1438536 [Mycena vulgaris]|nr:hypothetical protein DFH09DRAFT_1438536 [Mycena vulgaris]